MDRSFFQTLLQTMLLRCRLSQMALDKWLRSKTAIHENGHATWCKMNSRWVVRMRVCWDTSRFTPPLGVDILRMSYAGLNSDVKSSQKRYSDSSHTKHVRSVSRHALQTFNQNLLNKSSNNQTAPRCNESHLQELSLKLDLQISWDPKWDFIKISVRSIPSN